MQSDVLVFDFQDGCPPDMRSTVAKGLSLAHITYPNKKLAVRVTELERDETLKVDRLLWMSSLLV